MPPRARRCGPPPGRAAALVATALLLAAATSPRPPAARPAPSAAAAAMVRLFDATCLRMTGDVARLRRTAAARHLAPRHDPASRLLLVRPGIVYDASTPAGPLALLSFDDGLCGIAGGGVDAAGLLARLAATLRREGVTATPSDAAPGPPGATDRTDGTGQTYTLAGGPVASHLMLMVALHTADGAEQASLLARAPAPAPAPPPASSSAP